MRRGVVVLLFAGSCGGVAAREGSIAVPVASVGAVTHPAPVVTGPGARETTEAAIQLVATSSRLCARADGRIYCTAGIDSDQPLVREANDVSAGTDLTSLAVGSSHWCAATRSGRVRCWGDNQFGQLGAKLSEEKHDEPVDVVGITGARRVFGGPWHTCAVLEDGAVRCWGRNENGQTGSDTTYAPEARQLAAPFEVPGIKAEEIACSFARTCARTRTKEVWCWGASATYLGGRPSNERPHAVAALAGLDAIAANESGMCGLRQGNVFCWGGTTELVTGAGGMREQMAIVPGIEHATQIALGGSHGCALLADGMVSCFGHAYSGGLGRTVDENTYETVPAAVVEGLPRVVAISASNSLTCALTRDSEAFCWGRWYTEKGAHLEAKPVRVRLR